MGGSSRVVVVTGASAGIGRAAARRFAREGWDVALIARGVDGLEAAAREARAEGVRALVVPVDVADADAVEAAADRVERELGPIDVWVNNAMATVFCEAIDVEPADWRRTTEVTYHGAVWGTLAALRRMRTRDRGTIVQVGSALAYRSIPLQAPYCAAKSALRGFTDALRCELIHARSRVRLTMVHLAAFNTPQFDWARNRMGRRQRPAGRPYQPEIAANAIVRAATDPRRERWVGLEAVQAIVGQRVLPGWLDRKLAHDAWEGQFAPPDAAPPPARDNLYAPLPGDAGAHGRFDASARRVSLQQWASERLARPGAIARGGIALGGLALGGIVLGTIAVGGLLRSRAGDPGG